MWKNIVEILLHQVRMEWWVTRWAMECCVTWPLTEKVCPNFWQVAEFLVAGLISKTHLSGYHHLQAEDCLHGDEEGGDIEGLEEHLGRLLSVFTGIEWSLRQ